MTNTGPRSVRNPVVRGVAPDPSACRVGADYFLATSTLEFWPGIPIRHSTDLASWEIIGFAITRPSQYRRDGLPGQLKLYAPTRRYHAGRFYLACTNVAAGQGNFIVSSADPAGPWSDAVWVDNDGFDPSLTFDGGKTYYTRRTVVAGQEGSGPVVQAEVDVDTGALLTPTKQITPGAAGYRSNDIEAPHLYRIGQWWYLFSAEGGTWKGHMETVARSRSPWGPFEGHQHNPVLTHRHRVGHPIQSTGHAELLDDVNQNWWVLFLGTRHHGAVPWHHLGRETFLAPLTWGLDSWPIIGNAGTVELDQTLCQPLPSSGAAWSFLPNPWTSGWTTREAPPDEMTIVGEPCGGTQIQLPASDRTLDDGTGLAAGFVRQTEFTETFEATVSEMPSQPGAAGVAIYASPAHYYSLMVSLVGSIRRITLRKHVADLVVEEHLSMAGTGALTMRISATPDTYTFSVRDAGATVDPHWMPAGTGLARLISAETSQTYSGARFAVLAHRAETSFKVPRQLSTDAGVHGSAR